MNRFAIILTLLLTGCVHKQLPSCEERIAAIEGGHLAKDREILGVGKIPPNTVVAFYYDREQDKYYGVLIAGPHSLAPEDESEFKHTEDCSTDDGTAHIYQAMFEGKPGL